MTSSPWSAFRAAEPAFAESVQSRFQQYGHHVLATLRSDGSPRLSGLEVNFRFGELWLGMMPSSRKARDLLRDPRFALHTNPGADDATDAGDARISGRAHEVTEPGRKRRFADDVQPPEPFHLFRVGIGEVVRTSVEGDELVVRSWSPGAPLRTRRRR
ncbi:pyridoxamine 5'-phosphate oxidase family protein [Streptomyces sp. NPDC003023]|uniref:pyridoxamine 5'-phosphate oxidase family protein n=1 Tax=Streptomyces sp. NPDC003023 TaxID=3364675 RepID=UPI0036944858